MDLIHVIGHRNPDTDAICSAIGYAAYLREARGMDARAACCGEISARSDGPGHGATVTVSIPAVQARPDGPGAARVPV